MNTRSSSRSARTVSDWLRDATPLGALLSQTRQTGDHTEQLRTWLNQPWAAAVRVVQIRDRTLVVYCEDAATLALFRYRIPEAIRHFRSASITALDRIEAKVRPAPQRPRAESNRGQNPAARR